MRSTSVCWVLSLISLFCGAIACHLPESVSPDAVAQVADKQVTLSDWRDYLARQAVGASADLDSRVLSRLLDQLVDELILKRWAQDEGFLGEDVSPEESWAIVLARLSAVAVPTSAEEDRWAEAHRSQLRVAERVRLIHLIRDDLDAAEAVLAELHAVGAANWKGFQKAEEEPMTLAVASLPAHLVDVVARLDINHRGEVIDAGDRYHVLWVEERLPARMLSSVEAAERAQAALRRERTAERRRQVVEEGRDRYNARVWAENLPFDYQGSYRRDDR